MDRVIENLQVLGPVFAAVWAVTLLCVLIRPQRYFNSILLMISLLVTMLFTAGFFKGDGVAYFLLACFLVVMVALFLVPVLLIVNGVQLLKRESLSLAHVLSLALGIFVGTGEIAAVAYVLGLSDFLSLDDVSPILLLVVFTVFYFSFLVLSFVVYSVFIQLMPHLNNFNYIIIHGCGLAGGERPTKLLSNRIDKAIEVYRKCKVKPVIIPSGGQGEDEKISEALAMKNYLLEHGIPEEHILMEDRSTTTRENLIYSKMIIDGREGKKKTALISSNYHIYRCLRLARDAGLRCTGIGADVALYYWPSALIREFIAVFFTKKFFFWAMAGYVLFISPMIYMFLS